MTKYCNNTAGLRDESQFFMGRGLNEQLSGPFWGMKFILPFSFSIIFWLANTSVFILNKK